MKVKKVSKTDALTKRRIIFLRTVCRLITYVKILMSSRLKFHLIKVNVLTLTVVYPIRFLWCSHPSRKVYYRRHSTFL